MYCYKVQLEGPGCRYGQHFSSSTMEVLDLFFLVFLVGPKFTVTVTESSTKFKRCSTFQKRNAFDVSIFHN